MKMTKEDFIKKLASECIEYMNPFTEVFTEDDARRHALTIKLLINMGCMKISFPTHEISESLFEEATRQLADKRVCWSEQ